MKGNTSRRRAWRTSTTLAALLALLSALLVGLVQTGGAGAASPRKVPLPSNAHWARDAHGNLEAIYTLRTATPPPQFVHADSGKLTGAQAAASYTGAYMGPHANTYGGKATITAITKHTPASGHPYWTEGVKVTHPSPEVVMAPAGVHPDSCAWYAMYCWGWAGVKGIIDQAESSFSRFWEDFLHPCVTGAETGLIGTFGGPLVSKIWFYEYAQGVSNVMDLSPEGFAIGLMFSCTINVLKR